MSLRSVAHRTLQRMTFRSENLRTRSGGDFFLQHAWRRRVPKQGHANRSRAFARTHRYPRCFDRIVSLGTVAIEAEASERGEPRLPFVLGHASRIRGPSVSRRLTVLA
jgi:hypothetical protein